MCVYGEAKYRMLAFDIGQKCSVYTEHEMCVYGEALILRIKEI